MVQPVQHNISRVQSKETHPWQSEIATTFFAALSKVNNQGAAERSLPSNQNSQRYMCSTVICGIYFDDAVFAEDIRRFEDVRVSTDKKINWGATGAHQLTSEEISELREKYDITNLTPQEFYDLMSDMTKLDAISAEDVVSRYQYKSEIPYFENTGCGFFGDFALLSSGREKPIKNFMGFLQDQTKYLGSGLSYVKSNEFRKINSSLFNSIIGLYEKFQSSFQESFNNINRLVSIFAPLERNPSEISLPDNDYFQNDLPLSDVSKEHFDDAAFINFIQKHEGVNVKADKKINWGATGTHQLTSEEISRLQNKYDITNMTPQEFYDLLSDLTGLNAISAKDATAAYYGRFTALNHCGTASIRNFMEILQNGRYYFGSNLSSANKLLFIFELLQRNSPKTILSRIQ